MTPLMQTLTQGALILVASVFIPVVIRAARNLIAKQPVGNIGSQLKALIQELMVTGEEAGSWFTRFVPVFVFAAAIIVSLVTPTVMTESVMTKLSDVAVVSALIAAALAALALSVVDQGGHARFGHVGLVMATLLTASAAAGSSSLAPRIFAIIAIVLVAGEMMRKTTIPYVGFSRVVIQMALAMFGLTLGFVAAHVAYGGFEVGTLVVKAGAVIVALVLVEEITDRVKLSSTDRLILATSSAVIAFLITIALRIQTLV